MSTTALPTSPDARHGLGRQLRLYASTFARNKSAMLGLVIVVGFPAGGAVRALAGALSRDAAGSIKLAQKLLPPSSAHWFGTDEMGNDVFSRVILGAHLAQIGLTITVIAALIGVPLGVIAGYFGGRVQECIMRVTDIFLSVPGLVLAIAIVGALGPGILNAMIALSLVWWPGYVRLVQAKTLSLKGEVYIDAARMMGAGPLRIVFVHILPTASRPSSSRPRWTWAWPSSAPPAWVSWPGRAAARAGMGRDDLRGPQLPAAMVVVLGLSRPGHLPDRAGFQPDRRRAARRARPQTTRLRLPRSAGRAAERLT